MVGIVDGDTIDVKVAGATKRVRYIGMNTPERGQCFSSEATSKNRELVAGNIVTLVRDVSETDRYGRLLRYVYVGELFVNAELVRLGYANTATYPPDVRHSDLFRSLEREARGENRGLWDANACSEPPPASAPPTPPPTTPPTQQPDTGNCHASYPDFCIPPPPPDLDCGEMDRSDFTVRWDVTDPDPHGFDRDKDGVGCES